MDLYNIIILIWVPMWNILIMDLRDWGSGVLNVPQLVHNWPLLDTQSCKCRRDKTKRRMQNLK